ncbi:type IV secretory system conjugative DNA transfer family protein [Planctomycetes bacterium TBK1r]|uniref:Type IV secretory system Conjugative DNA transfer n=1 Tax=Stieleria magnilauensis TaxID=2527963 RepID=A0ABX5XHJ9_9BACT|nr:Type IV secretory system Conjugative DNA transfer [Planctomycetes bacterium TBK1r]
MSQAAPRPQEVYTFPFKHIAAVSLCVWAVMFLSRYARAGQDAASLALIAVVAIAVQQSFKVMDGLRLLAKSRQSFKGFKEAGTALAHAGYASFGELAAAGLYGETGLVLGEHTDERGNTRLLRYDGPNAVTIIGPPAAQKSTSVFMPSLLPTSYLGGIGHSTIVNDPAGEMYAVSHTALQAAGYEVLTVTPWPALMSDRLGIPVVDAGLDLWSDLDLDGDPKRIPGVVRSKMSLIYPGSPKDDAKDKFFRDGGKRLSSTLGLYAIAHDREPTLPMIRRMLMEGPGALSERLQEASESDAFGGLLGDEARGLADIAANAPEQFSGYLGTSMQGLDLYDHYGEMAEHFRSEGLKPWRLKEHRPVVVFLMYPTEKTRTHQHALNLTLSHLFEQIAAHPDRTARVSALIDETAGAGYLPNLLKAMEEYRKYGLRIANAFQDLKGQTELVYGPHATKQIIGASEVIWASGIREPEMLAMLSKKTGETTIVDGNMSDPMDSRERSAIDQKHSWSHKTRPVLRDDEIRQLPASQALVLHSNLPITIVEKTPYWTRREWKRIAGRNPSQGS